MHARSAIVACACACALLALATAEECPADRAHILTLESKLHRDILCGYNSDYRPVKDHKTAVTVKVRFALKYISFDALEETITIHSWLALQWKDEYLPWEPSQYGGLKETQVESHEIWTPRLALFNSDATMFNTDVFYTTCLASYDGTVTCVPPLAHYAICRTSMRLWPYDTQNCTLSFGAWMHTGEQINFTFYNTQPIVIDDYKNGPGWKLISYDRDRSPTTYNESTYPILRYTFTLRREAAGLAAIVVVPSVAIVILTLTSLLLDIRDNTRLVLACFSLFGHFTFLSEIGYDIPKHSSDTPIILLFLRDSMVVTLVAILVTLLLMSLRRRASPPPAWLVSVTQLAHRGPGRYVLFTEFDPIDVKILAEDITEAATIEDRARATSEWIQFANLINSIVFLVTLLVYLILIFSYIPYGG